MFWLGSPLSGGLSWRLVLDYPSLLIEQKICFLAVACYLVWFHKSHFLVIEFCPFRTVLKFYHTVVMSTESRVAIMHNHTVEFIPMRFKLGFLLLLLFG